MKKLASYAVQKTNSKGRLHEIEDAFDRNDFERDKSRIIHTQSFRRLQGKTQVFENSNGDDFRTRITHSIEVADVASSIARQLNLNESLAEIIALAHDLGHAPYGHLGQDVLEDLMKEHGGFEHNWQTLRIAIELESPYSGHKGLNLTYETLEGMLKHCSNERALEMIDSDNKFLNFLGKRFIQRQSPSLEAQIVDRADSVAYLHADMEDAINMLRITPDAIADMSPKFSQFWAKAQAEGIRLKLDENMTITRTIKAMMTSSIRDLVETSRENIERSGVKTLDDVRNADALIAFSPKEATEHKLLKKMSDKLIYNHNYVASQRARQQKSLESIFSIYESDPNLIKNFDSSQDKYRQIADAIASLTDRGVTRELNRLKDARSLSVESNNGMFTIRSRLVHR